MSGSWARPLWIAGLLLALALVAGACGPAGASGPPGSAPHGETEEGSHHEGENHQGAAMAHLVLDEWSITGEDGEALDGLPAGESLIEVHNDGKTVHQYAIWEGGRVAGDSVDGVTLVAKTGLIQPGDMATLEMDLEPGDYLLTCPITGHTERGMHEQVSATVRAP